MSTQTDKNRIHAARNAAGWDVLHDYTRGTSTFLPPAGDPGRRRRIIVRFSKHGRVIEATIWPVDGPGFTTDRWAPDAADLVIQEISR